MNERIRAVRKSAGMNQETFGSMLGKSRIAITSIESGKSGVDDTFILLLCKTFDVDEMWLRTGSGEMRPSADASENLKSLIDEAMKDASVNYRRIALEIFAGLDDRGWEAMAAVLKQIKGE